MQYHKGAMLSLVVQSPCAIFHHELLCFLSNIWTFLVNFYLFSLWWNHLHFKSEIFLAVIVQTLHILIHTMSWFNPFASERYCYFTCVTSKDIFEVYVLSSSSELPLIDRRRVSPMVIHIGSAYGLVP